MNTRRNNPLSGAGIYANVRFPKRKNLPLLEKLLYQSVCTYNIGIIRYSKMSLVLSLSFLLFESAFTRFFQLTTNSLSLLLSLLLSLFYQPHRAKKLPRAEERVGSVWV